MAAVKVNGLSILVSGYYDNNSPYFQVSVPRDLRSKLGQSKASIALIGLDRRQHVDQCQHLRNRFKAYFCALRAQHAPPKPLNVIANAWLVEVAVTRNWQPLPTLLSDAVNDYINNHKNGSDQQFKSKQHCHWQRLIDLVGDISLDGLTREHARRYRDNRLANHIKQPSVQREISSNTKSLNAFPTAVMRCSWCSGTH